MINYAGKVTDDNKDLIRTIDIILYYYYVYKNIYRTITSRVVLPTRFIY